MSFSALRNSVEVFLPVAGSSSKRFRGADLFALFPWIALGVCLSVSAFALFSMKLDVDEIEFFRATRFVLQGKVPYLGFWEHHTPLQWYLMAPVMALFARLPSAGSFLAMRLAQVPFWAGSAVICALLLRRKRVPRPLILLVLAMLFSNPAFSVKLVEYRIDAPMNFFYLLGLYFLEATLDSHRLGAWRAWAAGFSLGLSCLASQRIVLPVLLTTVLYLASRPEGKWGFNRRMLPVVWGD